MLLSLFCLKTVSFVRLKIDLTEKRLSYFWSLHKIYTQSFTSQYDSKIYADNWYLTHFHSMFYFYTPVTSENFRFSDVYRGYRSGTLVKICSRYIKSHPTNIELILPNSSIYHGQYSVQIYIMRSLSLYFVPAYWNFRGRNHRR